MAQRGVNKVILLGNLGKDPEIKYMPNGNAVANITLATSETWNDKSSGEKKEKQNGIVLYSSENWQKLWASILRKAQKSTLKANCKPVNGRGRMDRIDIRQKSWSISVALCRCWTVVAMPVVLRLHNQLNNNLHQRSNRLHQRWSMMVLMMIFHFKKHPNKSFQTTANA